MEKVIFLLFILLQTVIVSGDSISKYINISDRLAINYQTDTIRRCSDYALYKTINNTNDISADYSTINAINIDPSENFELFRSLYCMTMYSSYSQLTRRMFESKFICGLLLTNDGYYIYEGDSNISLKLPYPISRRLNEKIYQRNNPDKIRVSLGLIYGMWNKIDLTTGSRRAEQIPNDLMLEVITSMSRGISKEVNLRINNYFNTENQYMVTIPFFRSTGVAVAPVTGVTSIWVMTTDNETGDTPYVVVAGSSVEINQFCLGYTRNGMKYYTTFSNSYKVAHFGLSTEKLFKTPRVAAESGYYYDGWLSNVQID